MKIVKSKKLVGKHCYLFFTKKTLRFGGAVAFLTVTFCCYLYYGDIYFSYNPAEATFSKLNGIREEKKAKVRHYLNRQKITGEEISQNRTIVRYFMNLHSLYKKGAFNGSEYRQIERILEELFVSELDKFYDLLFLDNDGNIFFTIKREDDFLGNIHEKRFDELALFRTLRNKKIKKAEFVDYEYYSISDEPASFFISPVFDNNHVIGTIVLQLPINRINAILTDRTGLGRTGEVYLVNHKQLMITPSRFIDDVTFLNKLVDTEAVKRALTEKKGNKIIKDYRGKRVFSSYEQFDFEGTTWIIIAEIDEDEIITEIYRSGESALFVNVMEYLSPSRITMSKSGKNPAFGQNLPPQNSRIDISFPEEKETIKVDTKEFKKSSNHEVLKTFGVATCTAITISYPGKFGYLIHLTPTDYVYVKNHGWFFFTKYLLKDNYTDFVDTVLKRIDRFDITQSEKQFLRFGIFATHDASFKTIIHKLINSGIELSQIKLLYKNNFDRVSIAFDYEQDQVWSKWGKDAELPVLDHEYNNALNLGEIVMRLSKI